MDDPDGDVDTLERTYARFRLVNAVVSNQRAVYRRWVRPCLSATQTRACSTSARAAPTCRGRCCAGRAPTGCASRSPRSTPTRVRSDWALAQPAEPGPRAAARLELRARRRRRALRRGDLEPRAAPPRGAGVRALLADSERLAGDGGVAVHGDIERTRLGYVGFALGTLPFERNLLAGSYIRADGSPRSGRSHTAAELAAVLPAGGACDAASRRGSRWCGARMPEARPRWPRPRCTTSSSSAPARWGCCSPASSPGAASTRSCSNAARRGRRRSRAIGIHPPGCARSPSRASRPRSGAARSRSSTGA